MTLRPALTLLFVLGTLVSTLTQSAPADWPQWQGPDRNGLSTETGLLKQWPAGGPPQRWSVASLRIQDGTEIWQRNILRDFSGRQIPWLISESPLVDGNHVIVTPGGPRAGIVALDKLSGKTVWASDALSDEAGYASPIAGDVQGVRVYMTLTSSAGVGVRASD